MRPRPPSFIGQTITADGSTAQLVERRGDLDPDAGPRGHEGDDHDLDAKGNVVATQTTSLTAGSQTFTWDGKTLGRA